jgi:hypothetical protein
VVPVRAASAAADGDDDAVDEWDDAWASGEQSGVRLQPVDQAGRAPRWQIAVVAILLVAVIVALVVALSSGGDGPPAEEDAPTPAGTTTGRTTDTTGAVRSGRLVGEIHLENATIRIPRG